MNKIFVENTQHCNLRKKLILRKIMLKQCTMYATETLTFLGPRTLEIVTDSIKKTNFTEEFKLKIKL